MAESLITQVGRPLLGVLPEDSPASPPPHGDDDGSAGDSIPLGPPSSRKTDTHLRYGRGRGSFQDLSREQKRELAHSRRLRSPAPVSSTTSLPARRRNSAKQMARRRRKANLVSRHPSLRPSAGFIHPSLLLSRPSGPVCLPCRTSGLRCVAVSSPCPGERSARETDSGRIRSRDRSR